MLDKKIAVIAICLLLTSGICGCIDEIGEKEKSENDKLMDFFLEVSEDDLYYSNKLEEASKDQDYIDIFYYAKTRYEKCIEWNIQLDDYDVSGKYKELQDEFIHYLNYSEEASLLMWQGAEYALDGEYSIASGYFEYATTYIQMAVICLKHCTEIVEEIIG